MSAWVLGRVGAFGVGFMVGAGLVRNASHEDQANNAAAAATTAAQRGFVTREEVRKHCGGENGSWVTLKGRVYDVSEELKSLPCRDIAPLALGTDLAAAWAYFPFHHTHPAVQAILSRCELGVGVKDDGDDEGGGCGDFDPYEDEPPRNPGMPVLSQRPFRSSTTPGQQAAGPGGVTPAEHFHVHNHLPVPRVDPATVVRVDRGGGQVAWLASSEMESSFEVVHVRSEVVCASRSADKDERGMAMWTGVRLADVLRTPNSERSDALPTHVLVEGHDGFSTSIPLDVALRGVKGKPPPVLATRMNGAPLPLDHGFPVRLVVPGLEGARSVKWVSAISLRGDPANSVWQRLYCEALASEESRK